MFIQVQLSEHSGIHGLFCVGLNQLVSKIKSKEEENTKLVSKGSHK